MRSSPPPPSPPPLPPPSPPPPLLPPPPAHYIDQVNVLSSGQVGKKKKLRKVIVTVT